VVLIILGVLSLIFSVMDLVRFGCRLSFRRIFKQKEERSFSSMTKFLVSIFFTFLIFGREIPYLGLTFITVGDLFAKAIGVLFGKRKLFKSRTIAGTLGFAGGCLAAGYILYLVIPGVPLVFVIAGSLLAALIELFSEAFDDNFTVGLISSAFLAGIRNFFNV
jgi:dolichol kinase